MTPAVGTDPLLAIAGLRKTFRVSLGPFRKAELVAVKDVTLTVPRGVTLAVVGESGSGKTTLARLILGLLEPTAGSIRLEGTELVGMSASSLSGFRARMQMVFQDPLASLSPWQTIGHTIGEPLELHTDLPRPAIREKVVAILQRVGLPSDFADRYPHQLSGGQLQRVSVARALITSPGLVVLDEPTSSLDLSVQVQILALLRALKTEMQLAYLFISHDLGAVRYLADDIAVMYMGRLVEYGPAASVLAHPAHPYTRSLLAALPRPDPRLRTDRPPIGGEQPSMLDAGAGCPFYGRCPMGIAQCATEDQQLIAVAPRHAVACWRVAPPTPPAGGKPSLDLAGTSSP